MNPMLLRTSPAVKAPRLLPFAWIILLMLSGSARAQLAFSQPGEVSITQRLGAQVPFDAPFTDETGAPHPLRDYLHDKPVILHLVYFDCPMLCTQSLNGLQRALRAIPESAGECFTVLSISIDPRETSALALAKKTTYLKAYDRQTAAVGWRFLTSPDPDAIRRLAASVGFQYHWDVRSASFAHSSALIVLTPNGKVSQYLFGVEYDAADLRAALATAGQQSIGQPVQPILLYCLHYNPATGRYSLIVSRVVQLFGGLTLIALATFVTLHLRRDASAATAARRAAQ